MLATDSRHFVLPIQSVLTLLYPAFSTVSHGGCDTSDERIERIAARRDPTMQQKDKPISRREAAGERR